MPFKGDMRTHFMKFWSSGRELHNQCVFACLFSCSTSTGEKTTKGVESTYDIGLVAKGTGLRVGPLLIGVSAPLAYVRTVVSGRAVAGVWLLFIIAGAPSSDGMVL